MAASARRLRRSKAQHRKVRGKATPQAIYPMFRMDAAVATGAARLPGYAVYVGRIGALAVALGVGMAVGTGQGIGLGVARADDTGASSGDSSGAVSSSGGAAPDSAGAPGASGGADSSTESAAEGAGSEGSTADAEGSDPETVSGEAEESDSAGEDLGEPAGESADGAASVDVLSSVPVDEPEADAVGAGELSGTGESDGVQQTAADGEVSPSSTDVVPPAEVSPTIRPTTAPRIRMWRRCRSPSPRSMMPQSLSMTPTARPKTLR